MKGRVVDIGEMRNKLVKGRVVNIGEMRNKLYVNYW